MILDSEEQRGLLLDCINSAGLSGPVIQLMTQLTEIAKLIETVQTAKVEVPDGG